MNRKSNRMKIIFLEAVQSHGGARKSTIELAKRLGSQGHHTVIVDFWGNCKEFVDEAETAGVPVKILAKRDKPIAIFTSKNVFTVFKNLISFILDWFSLRKEFSKFSKNFNADIVIVNNIKTNSILKKGSPYKIVYFARGWFAYNSLSVIKKILFKYNSDYFIGVSQSTRQAIYTGGLAPLEKIFVVPNAIDLDKVDEYRKRRKEPDSSPILTILHCGGFLSSKGQGLSIELARRLVDKGIPFKMILMGAVYDSSASIKFLYKIKKDITMFNLSEQIEIIENHKNPYEVFKDADILIHPSDTEGLPRVVMEALAFGMPVIANPVGGVLDFVLNNYTGFVANHNDIDDYYEAIVKLYEETSTREKISSNGRELIQRNYSPEMQVYSFENVIGKMIVK